MYSTTSFFVLALIVCGAFAQQTIDESKHKKECPAGFNFVGKQCAKTLNAQPEVVCPSGTIKAGAQCAKYVGKLSECPAGYWSAKGACERTKTAPIEVSCPAGYTLTDKDTCVTKIALPDKKACPSGSLVKGDNCVRQQATAPSLNCPAEYTLVGRRCQREETFDCTPSRKPVEPSKDDGSKATSFRAPSVSKGKEPSRYTIPQAAPVVEEYVIQETCRRIITEAARYICANGSTLSGKVCLTDVEVAPIIRPGGYVDQAVPAARYCPDGYAEASKNGCSAVETVLPELFCPSGTQDDGSRCATFVSPRTVCPEGFYLEGKSCNKTIFAAPIVEYTVTYTCTGKDCANHH